MHIHTTKDGKQIPLNELELSHLKNIINHQRRMAKDGVVVEYGSIGFGCEYPYYDEDIIYGNEALKHLRHQDYLDELNRRQTK